jgi:hypothetical protein
MALPMRGEIPETVPWVAISGKGPGQVLAPFPRQSGSHLLADTAESSLKPPDQKSIDIGIYKYIDSSLCS